MQALNKQALRIMKLFGLNDVKYVRPSVGPEQEYFLVDKEMYDKRKDLIYTGRTLFGAKSPKGQEMEDHYFGSIKPRVAAFMEELNEELWKLGILAKTEHNEVAPAQHELAPIYTTLNIATDHNQLTMEMLQRVAKKHGLVCLLHEKPFAGVNGSGKHNNWSLETDTGINLLAPGDTPHQNARFLLFLCAVLQAVDDYQDLLRLSVATAGNDHRLGANEAPPAVVSVFLGDELTSILDALEKDAPYNAAEKTLLRLGVHVLPRLPKDTTDRNRTSPFAFTGNKFEFRMLGSSNSIACANIMLNAAVAEALKQFADRLEGSADFNGELQKLIRDTVKNHKRIIFNGNGYDEKWIEEATKVRGLFNFKTTPDCMPRLLCEKNVALLTSHKIYSVEELHSRCDIMLDNYCKTINIEALTMIDMARKEILPAVSEYVKVLSEGVVAKKAACPTASCAFEEKLIERLSKLTELIDLRTGELETKLIYAKGNTDVITLSAAYRDEVIPAMQCLREVADEAETLTAEKYWPFPTYGQLLFGVR
jgi:glutamine synthetase